MVSTRKSTQKQTKASKLAAKKHKETAKKHKETAKKHTTLSQRRKYRERVKNSTCRGLDRRSCSTKSHCSTTANNIRKSYCRHSKNKPLQ